MRKSKSMKDPMNYGEWFDELYDDRKAFVQISRKNDFEHGIWQSTVDKYAEPDHFIYELLQNAEGRKQPKSPLSCGMTA